LVPEGEEGSEAGRARVSSASLTGHGCGARSSEPLFHAGFALRLVGILRAGTLGVDQLFQRCAPTLEQGDYDPQDAEGDEGGQGCGDGESRAGECKAQLGVNDNLLKLNRSGNPGVAVRRFRPAGRFSPLGG